MVGLIVVSTYDFALCMHKLASVGFLWDGYWINGIAPEATSLEYHQT
jgi:hypothetical protein